MEYSKEDLMEAKKQILGVGENMGTEESKKIWEENAQFWDNAMGDESNEFHREVVRPKVTELLSPNPADYILDIACGNGNYSSYSNLSVAKYFWAFGMSVLIGCIVGFCAAYAYLPNFYATQNADGLLPDIPLRFHFSLLLLLVIVPAVAFTMFSVLYAFLKLKRPALDLMYERKQPKIKNGKASVKELSFLQSLKRATLRSKKVLAFFIAFAAFCFSAMVQMSISMIDLSSATFAWMIFMIGLILAFLSLLLSLSEVVKGNSKTVAMMRIMGYDNATCSKTVLGAYRPFACVGFIIGTLYQYGLLKLVMTFVFSNVENMPEYNFDWLNLLITLVAFVVV